MRAHAVGYASGTRIRWHRHDWHQLVYAPSGVLTVDTDVGSWTVPPARAIWIPATVSHQLTARSRVQLRTIYVRQRLRHLPARVTVIEVSPLLRELVLRIIALDPANTKSLERLARVLFDELTSIDAVPIELPTPPAGLAQLAADRLRREPALDLDDLARSLSTSRRTIERHFVDGAGMSLGEWRHRARLALGIELLATGHSVTSAAVTVGYSTPSSFISAFRRRLGTTPGQYFDTPTRPPSTTS